MNEVKSYFGLISYWNHRFPSGSFHIGRDLKILEDAKNPQIKYGGPGQQHGKFRYHLRATTWLGLQNNAIIILTIC